ncbi:sensor histidine kinase [Primorskyibacter sp. S187A]|uniref:sensor histidine kinase n=1 Tax=Primorskyibacter sp. S187A TaxID=3415130 RepID=UPI003C7E0F30
MKSVRLRLLIMALAPLVVLMPLLLWLGMSRWTSDYDEVLIANVESDLRIAAQYLDTIMDGTDANLAMVAGSKDFSDHVAQSSDLTAFLEQKRNELGLDFLYFQPQGAPVQTRSWPVVENALAGARGTVIDIFENDDFAALPPTLKDRARIQLVPTEAAVPTDRNVEDRGMVVHAATPVQLPGATGALVGGILLNKNLQFIDTINELVYLNAVTGGTRQGTATLFLDDVRISTNVRLFDDERALGTRVSAEVRQAVLGDGKTWLDRAFVVNDWYISGYLPITDSFGARVGMLYVGFSEAPFTNAKRAAVAAMLVAFFVVLMISAPVFLWLAKSIFAPLERMTKTMSTVARGNLSARNGDVGTQDEVGIVAAHMDRLLDGIEDRDEKLRAWARDLETRVEDRTQELKDANQKLETTYKQLVMNEKLASIGEITAGVAHEINNPVAVIQGNVDVIRETLGAGAAPIKTELSLIDRQVTRIEAIVGKLLQFARPSEYASSAQVIVLPLVVADCLVLVDHVFTRGHITVKTDFHEVPAVRVDTGEMQQVIINLLMNAAQAMEMQGTLSLTLEAASHEGRAGARLSVADTGPGVPEDVLKSVFDPFFTTKLSEGTGLGLSISQTIIQRAKGMISVENKPTGGAIFHVWLPSASMDELAAE